MDDNKCGFCHTGEESVDVCGSLHKDTFEGKTIVAHHKCMQYSAMLVQYKSDKFGGFKKHQVLDEIRRGSRLICSLCKNDKTKKNKKGASSGCALKTCRKTFHYYCVSMAPNTVAKRYRVAAGQKVVILYRVFCSKKHEELYRKNLKAEDVVGSQGSSSSESEGGESDDASNNKPSNNDDDDDNEYDDTTDVEPVHKKRRHAAQMDTEEEEDGEGQAGLNSPPMTPQEVVSETRKEYNSLLNRSQRSRGSLEYTNNDSDYEGGGDGLADVSTSSPPESEVSTHGQTSKGMFIFIPSKLEVGDLRTICEHTGYPSESSALWPCSTDTRRGLQDKHLPFVMWDIAAKLRKQDRVGVRNIFLDMNVSQYECLHAFHSQPTDEEDEAIHKRLFNVTSEVNCVFKKEVCRLVNLTVDHVKMFVFILSLPKSYIANIETTVFFKLHKWSPETVCSSFDAKSIRAGYELEKKTLLKLLKHQLRGKEISLSVYPQDAILGNIGDLCVARDIEFKIQTMPPGSGKTMKVLIVRNVDRSVVHYKLYLHKLLLWFLHEREGCEAYCVMSVKPGDGIRSLGDVLPDKVRPGDVHVYSAFQPQSKPTSCLLLHCPAKHSGLPNSNHMAEDEEDASFRVPDSQPSVYMDNAESQDPLIAMFTPRRSLRR